MRGEWGQVRSDRNDQTALGSYMVAGHEAISSVEPIREITSEEIQRGSSTEESQLFEP
jgi:hypothetical protein